MSGPIRLILAIHNHQPVGNFDHVVEEAYQDSYRPMLETLADYPAVKLSLHNSGSLLDWIEQHRPEYIEQLKERVDAGQVEILGGPFYEPILASIPSRDRVGQMQAYRKHLESIFGQTPRGMWVPERVWEQSFTRDAVAAGLKYTVLDDFHFKNAGFGEEELYGYFVTEDDGKMLSVFPISEKLRYTIPFAEPEETIEWLKEVYEKQPEAVVAFGDDGEKFGTWPGSKQHVYGDGWLTRFFQLLTDNQDWIRVVTFAQAVEEVSPLGRCYLPDCSYREMTEWALPTDRQLELIHLQRKHKNEPDWPEVRQRLRGGFWRNFLVKYPEAHEMYCRMREISDRLHQLLQDAPELEQTEKFQSAQDHLYRGQCNCPYWHGAFGGLYLPHLRNAIYHHLIEADCLVEQMAGKTGRWVEISSRDMNLDARQEIRIASDQLVAYLAPARGGHIYELDARGSFVNLLATLDRRPEPYHETILAHASGELGGQNETASVSDEIVFKQEDLHLKLSYDQWARKSLVDHVLPTGMTMEEFRLGGEFVGEAEKAVFKTSLKRSADRVEAVMSRRCRWKGQTPLLTKSVAVSNSAPSELEIHYRLDDLVPGKPVHLAVEFNFAAMAAGVDNRYFYGEDGSTIGYLGTDQDLAEHTRIGLVDEWLGLDASLESSQPAGIWTYPLETVSQSEGGFELVHQSCAVILHWEFTPDSSVWETSLRLNIDTSAARARRLAAAPGSTRMTVES
ncbi:alpha-amylase/4-alpha-glucanotransferase domain-containing protein [Rubinisphaera italica]|uniref:Alpha-amylase 1 n=1 Tax=Rubinisphaera italica TaxID=2527969 RepID=A0A5C5XAW5_9PLAN|nr:alpha-amylase/4-alpha-glucanotransferase domain-containing protein [Rubinisphaera italica]TWT59918.1 Alpha-amylase 1 [Rubinisphaera italica]